MNEPLVSHISDTARWVAVYRGCESRRADALFRDPFAERLAGEKGQAMARLMPRQARNGWPLIVRTKLIDDLILACIQEGCDLVANLAAGLDTRPYRMVLPASLRWLEVDLPEMIAEKERLLANARPVCHLSRRAADLSNPVERAALFKELGTAANRALVITEGLLLYLEEPVVRAFTDELAAQARVRWWVFDLASPRLLQLMGESMGRALDNARMRFGPSNGVAFFETSGWIARDIRSLLREAARLRRLPWFMRPAALIPDPDPRQLGNARWSAVIRLDKQN